MEILNYIDKETEKIEKQKQNKSYRIAKLGSDIKKLENKLNRETEKETVIIKSEAKIKLFKNRIKIIELETIEELDKEYIKTVSDKDIQKLSSDLTIKHKKILEEIYYKLKEMAVNQKDAEEKYRILKQKLYVNQIQGHFENQFEQGGSLRQLYISPVNVKSTDQSVYLEKSLGLSGIQKIRLSKEDFEIK